MITRVTCLLMACVLPFECAAAEDDFSIANRVTRLQLRDAVDANDISSFTASSFLQAKNKVYFLGILDYQVDHGRHSTNGRIEGNVGGPFSNSPLGWVVRGRAYYHQSSVAAAGVQLSFNDLPELGPALKRLGITTFVQVLRNTSDPYFGDSEILHYYSIDIIRKRLALRGYNVFNTAGKNEAVRNSWADLIYSLNDRLDFYYRISDVTNTNGYLGPAGTTQFLGFRINWY
jgi:hypothetical protein